MRKFLIILTLAIALCSIMPMIAATDAGNSAGISITTQKFPPRVFSCDDRVVVDDNTENGNNGLLLTERKHNYAFEGESIHWLVFVLDKNKIEDVQDVVGTIGAVQGPGNDIEVECKRIIGDPFANATGNVTLNITTATNIFCEANETPLTFASVNCTVNEPLAGNNIICAINGVTNTTAFVGTGNLLVNGTNINFSANATAFTFNASIGGIKGNCSTGDLLNTSSVGSCSFLIASTAISGVNTTCNINGVSQSIFATTSGIFNLTINGINISVFVSPSTFVDFNSAIGGVNGNCTVNGLINSTSSGLCNFTITNIIPVTVSGGGDPFTRCNARVDQYNVTTFNPDIMAYYDCSFTVETPASMQGEYFITVEAIDSSGATGIMHENEYWFLNPLVALSVDNSLDFDEVMPGTTAYSNTILVGNDAETGSGVIMDMFISGTDFYDTSSSGARCPSTNQLALTNFGYYAVNGAFSTNKNIGADAYGYLPIPYSTDISGSKRIIRFNETTGGINCSAPMIKGVVRPNAIRGSSPSSSVVEQDWNCGNALSPGSEMAITFKLDMPEPCNGDFSDGEVYFWGEVI